MYTDHEGELRLDPPRFIEHCCQFCGKPFPLAHLRERHEQGHRSEAAVLQLQELLRRIDRERGKVPGETEFRT